MHLSLPSIVVKTKKTRHHLDQKQRREEERVDLFIFRSMSQSICEASHGRNSGQELNQGKNLEAGTKAESTEELCLLVCSACFLI